MPGKIGEEAACGTDQPPLDPARAATVAALLGEERLRELLEVLDRRLDGIVNAIPALPAGVEQLVYSIHQSQGSAGSLGLHDVMMSLRALEHSLTTLKDYDLNDRVVLTKDALAIKSLFTASRGMT